VNYIRNEVKSGNTKPDVSSTAVFSDDKYLQPVLEDDALLFSLDDLLDSPTDVEPNSKRAVGQAEELPSTDRIAELERQLQSVSSQFSEYRKQVEETLEKRWNDAEGTSRSKPSTSTEVNGDTKPDGIDFEGDYFESYSYNGMSSHSTFKQLDS
jgi:protein arginine N-methyltransferase 3